MKTEIALETACAPPAQPSLKILTRQPTSAYSGVRKQFVALVSAQLLLLVGLAAPKAYTLCHGQTVSLRATLIDPSDPVRGEYEDLSFTKVSDIETQLDWKKQEPVWVTLSKSADGNWSATAIAREKPALKAGQSALKGTIGREPYTDYESKKRIVSVNYGIEHFFVPQGKSTSMQVTAENPLIAQVAVDSSGEACIKQVSQENHKIFDATNLFNPFPKE